MDDEKDGYADVYDDDYDNDYTAADDDEGGGDMTKIMYAMVKTRMAMRIPTTTTKTMNITITKRSCTVQVSAKMLMTVWLCW